MLPEKNPRYLAFAFALLLTNIAPRKTPRLEFLKEVESLAAGLTTEEIAKALNWAQMEAESWKE